MHELYQCADNVEIIQGTGSLALDSAIIRGQVELFWEHMQNCNYPDQKEILLGRIGYNVNRLLAGLAKDMVGVEKMGRMLHGSYGTPANPVTTIIKIFNNFFNSEKGLNEVKSYLAARKLAEIRIVNEYHGAESDRKIILTSKAGNIHLTTWDD